LHTGDLGRRGERGRLQIVGRRADTIVTGGENVAPTEVEAVLLAHPAVADAGVEWKDVQFAVGGSWILTATWGATTAWVMRLVVTTLPPLHLDLSGNVGARVRAPVALASAVRQPFPDRADPWS